MKAVTQTYVDKEKVCLMKWGNLNWKILFYYKNSVEMIIVRKCFGNVFIYKTPLEINLA